MSTALRATSRTLAEYLRTGLLADPLVGQFFAGGMQVTLNTPQEMAGIPSQGLSVWLYRVLRDEYRLNAPPERIAANRVRPTPLPVRLYYLITPIVAITPSTAEASPEREQLILGKVLQLLHDRAVLRGADLRDTFAGTAAELHVRLETMSFEEITRIWQALQRPYQLSVCYEVSVIPVESERPEESLAPVMVALPEYAVIAGSGEPAP